MKTLVNVGRVKVSKISWNEMVRRYSVAYILIFKYCSNDKV